MLHTPVISETPEVLHQAIPPCELAEIVTRTLPESGIDRMTDQGIEEVIAIPALTAHI